MLPIKYGLFASLLFATAAHGADFRDINFGDSCKGIQQYESNKGLKTKSVDENDMVFSGQHLEHETEIHYNCHNNQFIRGTYVFWFDNFEKAKQFFGKQKTSFIRQLGLPTTDQGTQAYAEQMETIGIELKDEHKYVVTWKQAQRTLLLAATKSKEKNGQSWVSLDVTPNDPAMQHHH